MRLRSVTIQAFRSFGSEQTLDLASLAPGLYHVAGQNLVEPELEANGAGKSSLFEAPYWCLYGNTSRGVRGDAVVNWHSDERCYVITELDVAAGRLAVLRARDPNTLEIALNGSESRPVEQEELDGLLGMNAETFLYSVYFAQFVPAFVDLRPAEQMTVYSSVLNLDLWEAASERAAEERRSVTEKLDAERLALSNLEGQAEQLLSMSYDKPEAEWERKRKGREAGILSDLRSTQAKLNTLQKQSQQAKTESDKFRALRDQAQAQAVEVGKRDRQIRTVEQEIAKLRSRDYKNCPTCGAPVSDAHVKRELVKKGKEFEEAKAAADAAVKLHDKMLKDMVQYRDAEKVYLDLQKELGAVEAQGNSLQQTLTTTQAEANPYTKQKAEQAEQAAELEKALTVKERSVMMLEQQEAGAQYWVKEFKELRLSLITESLVQLTAESNEALFQLGLRNWALKFDTETVTKKGTVNRNFAVTVHTPEVTTPTPWEAWSGGESQRLRLATALGFSNLICSRAGIMPGVEFYDEPSSWLSVAGIRNLLEVLLERAKKFRKVILLADHRALNFGQFSGTILVSKTAKGSRIQ